MTYIPEVLVAIIIVLLVLRPIVQARREHAISRKLRQTRHPGEALAVMDTEVRKNRANTEFFGKLYRWFRL